MYHPRDLHHSDFDIIIIIVIWGIMAVRSQVANREHTLSANRDARAIINQLSN